MKTAIVSGCDANFFPLLLELIASIRRCPESQGMDICVLDAGLTGEQITQLSDLAARVVNPDWPTGLDTRKTGGKEYLKACVCRPFIPDIFPGYDMYLWLDADTWVQQWRGVQMFLDGASKGGRIALTNTADRCYADKAIRIKWIGNWPYKVKNFYSSNGKEAFGKDFAKKMVSEYILLAGCFALAANAKHWKRWQELVVVAANKGRIFPAEQLSLGKMIHMDGYKAELLPAYAHWLCIRKPLWDSARGLLVEPFVPHEPLGILHLSGVDAMRSDRTATIAIETTNGETTDVNYRYPEYDGGRVAQSRPKRA